MAKKKRHSNYWVYRNCENAIGYQFRDPSLLEKALTHASIRRMNDVCNERLEFLGDSVLALVISEYLYLTFRDFNEGDLSLIRSEVVSRSTLARIASIIKLHDFFIVSGMDKQPSLSKSVLANVFEAIVGAIYLDSGMAAAKKFILDNLRPEIEAVIKNPYQQNYKSLLQFVSQKYYGTTPSYEMLTGSSVHSKVFRTCAVIGSRKFIAADSKNKKDSEQLAAQAALQILALENPAIVEALQSTKPEENNDVRSNILNMPSLFHNSRRLLQYIVEKFELPPPRYNQTRTTNHQSSKVFFSHISLGGRSFPPATASKRKEAQRLAARRAMEILAEEYSGGYSWIWLTGREIIQGNHSPGLPLWYTQSWL